MELSVSGGCGFCCGNNACVRVGLCGLCVGCSADFWVAGLGWAFWGGGLPVVERVLLRCAKARGCWSFISHQSFIIYHSRSNCYFPCRRGSRDVRCNAKPKSAEGTCPCPFILFTFLGGLVWFLVRFLLFWFLPHQSSFSLFFSFFFPFLFGLALSLSLALSLPTSNASMNRCTSLTHPEDSMSLQLLYCCYSCCCDLLRLLLY